MKKTILVLIHTIIIVFSTHAQTDPEKSKAKKVKFGLRTGYEFQVNDSNLDNKPDLPYIGAFSDIRLRGKWSLQLELNLRSANREELYFNGFKRSYKEVYLTVPILMKYHINDKFKVYAGTQVLSASLKNDIFGIKKWNGVLGAEYNLSKKFFIETRFRHGFERRQNMSSNNFRNNAISIGVGYRF